MAVDRHAPPGQLGERRRPPVIAVRVRQDHRVDAVPREPNLAQARLEQAWRQTEIDEHAEAADIEDARIAGAAAGEDVELHLHAAAAFLGNRSVYRINICKPQDE